MSGVANQSWPSRLWLVRHGQSAGNVASDAAFAAGIARVELDERDVDVPLSELGERQAAALGHWFSQRPTEERPEVVLASPYARAVRTAELIRDRRGVADHCADLSIDERLREREFGILDRLTPVGIEQFFPEQAEIKRVLGKFYHRPPGGESWCDVILRLRSSLNSLSLHHSGKRVMIVAHEVVVLCFRYLIEGMTEAEVLKISAEGDVANCGVTEYACVPSQTGRNPALRLVSFNVTAPLEAEHAPVTSAPDVKAPSRKSSRTTNRE